MKQALLYLLLMLLLSACNNSRGLTLEDVPTLASPESLATASYLTQNAPPEGFREAVSYPEVDLQLTALPGWHYGVTLEFDGSLAEVPQETTASAHADVWYNQLSSARRVVVDTSGGLIGQEDNTEFEAVRLGPDTFLVRNGVCLSEAGGDAAIAADLRAGLLVGGVLRAVPTGRHAVLNGIEAWEYSFQPGDLVLPSINFADDGALTAATGELWVAPEYGVVSRFYVNIDVENALIFDREAPVNGRVALRYDVLEIAEQPNINIPFGC